ncbi:MAG: hypothetical protein ACT4QC_15095 [Planctomycetaceae bacterium]
MARRTWQLSSAVLAALAVCGFGAARPSQAGDQAASLVVRASDDDCEDCDECYDGDDGDDCKCHRRCCCCRLCLCRKLKLHCMYFKAAKCRPYRMLPYIPPELAPYIGPGTYTYGYDGGVSAATAAGACYPGYGYNPLTAGPGTISGYIR